MEVTGAMPGMNSGLNADDPTVAAVFCGALLHQGLIIAVIFAVLSIAWVAIRRPGGGAVSRAAVPEPAGRRVLRIGFGLRRREGACRVSRPAASPAATRRQRHGGRHELAGRLARRLG